MIISLKRPHSKSDNVLDLLSLVSFLTCRDSVVAVRESRWRRGRQTKGVEGGGDGATENHGGPTLTTAPETKRVRESGVERQKKSLVDPQVSWLRVRVKKNHNMGRPFLG